MTKPFHKLVFFLRLATNCDLLVQRVRSAQRMREEAYTSLQEVQSRNRTLEPRMHNTRSEMMHLQRQKNQYML